MAKKKKSKKSKARGDDAATTDNSHSRKEQNAMADDSPQELPPNTMESLAAEDCCPSESEVPPRESHADASVGDTHPTEIPPESLTAAEDSGVGAGATWHDNKKITGLWCISQNRNSWILVSGLGWKRLATNSDSSVVALTMLGAHAKQLNRNVKLKEDGGQIKEMYVW